MQPHVFVVMPFGIKNSNTNPWGTRAPGKEKGCVSVRPGKVA
jgi:hypothetical protein